jgi:hypothetical protein
MSKTKSREKWSESNNLRKAYDSEESWLLLPRVWYGTAVSMIMSHNLELALGLGLVLGLGLGLGLGLELGHLVLMVSSSFARARARARARVRASRVDGVFVVCNSRYR